MGPRRWICPAAGVLAVLLLLALLARPGGSAAPAVRADGTYPIPAESRARSFTFGPATAEGDRQAFLGAVARARPEARALLEEVDGLVSVQIGATGPDAAGTTTVTPDGEFVVVVDFATVHRQLGPRGVDRLVLHELGHVVDFALLPEALRLQLDAGVPAGWGCDDGHSGACAAPRERFAESFAKWASGDIGVDLSIGYRVPPPASLEDWGRPLAPLARARL